MARRINVQIVRGGAMFIEVARAITDSLREFDFDAHCYDTFDREREGDFNVVISSRSYWPKREKDAINIHVETDRIDSIYHAEKHKAEYSQYTRSLHWFDYGRDLTHEKIYFCPLGYSRHFDTELPKKTRWPYFELGATNTGLARDKFRRKFGLTSLIKPGSKKRLWGRERDRYIMGSKVNINVRAYEDYWFTPLHAAIILYKGKMLLQDDCGKGDYHFFEPYLDLFSWEEFPDKLNYWIDRDRERKEREFFIHEDMKANHPFEKYLYTAIGDLLEAYR